MRSFGKVPNVLNFSGIVLILLEDYRWLFSYCVSYTQVPKGLPYFAVEFGLDGGFAHVIENEDLVPHYFGKVLCMILFMWSIHKSGGCFGLFMILSTLLRISFHSSVQQCLIKQMSLLQAFLCLMPSCEPSTGSPLGCVQDVLLPPQYYRKNCGSSLPTTHLSYAIFFLL